MLLTQAAIVFFSRTTVRFYHKFKARSRGTCPSYKDSMHVGYNLIIAIIDIYIASSIRRWHSSYYISVVVCVKAG